MGVVGEGKAANKDLLQPSVYGIAQISRCAPGCLTASHIQMIVPALLALTDCSKEEAGDDIYLVEVAASALASVTLFGRHPDLKFITQDTLVTRFLNHLPIQQDEDEAKVCEQKNLIRRLCACTSPYRFLLVDLRYVMQDCAI